MLKRVLPLVILAVVTSGLAAQEDITEADARAAILAATTDAGADPDQFLRAYERRMREVDDDFRAEPHTLIRTAAYAVILEGPAQRLARYAAEAVRKMEPIQPSPWLDGVAIAVEPWQAGGDDIGRVVVLRDGVRVDPIASTLVPRAFSNAMGARFEIHAGDVIFPASAFLPGGRVDVVLIPERGDNIRLRIPPRVLSRLAVSSPQAVIQ